MNVYQDSGLSNKNLSTLRKTVAFFYIWVVIEGIFRKWIFPSLTNELHLVKFMIGFIILIQVNTQLKNVGKVPFKTLLYSYILFCFFSFVYAAITNSVFVAIIGIMDYLTFIPLIVAIPIILKDKEQIQKVFDFITVISIVIFALGVIQYLSPPSSFINRYATSDQERHIDVAETASGETFARVATIFSYVGSSACYLYFAYIVLIINFFQSEKKSFLKRNLNLTALGLACLNFFMTGSRVAVFYFIILTFSFIVYKFRKNLQLNVFLYVIVALIFGYILLTYVNVGKASIESWSTRFETGEQNEEYSGRSGYLANAIIDRITNPPAGLLGYGIGAEQNASNTLNKKDNIIYVEDEAERITLELGPVGFIIWYLLIIELFLFKFKVFRKTKDPYLKDVSFGFMVFSVFAVVLLRQTIVNWTDNLEWWTAVGLLLAIQKMDTRENIGSTSR